MTFDKLHGRPAARLSWHKRRAFGALLRMATFVAGLWSLVVAGCLNEATHADFRAGACDSSGDCPPSYACVEFVCIPAGSGVLPAGGIHAEVVPPPESGLRSVHFLDLGQDLDLRLPRPATYEADLVDAEAHGVTVGAHIAISGSPRIPGREVDVSTQILAGGRARFRLIEGSYSVLASPVGLDLPSFEFQGFTVRRQDSVQRKRFELPARGCPDPTRLGDEARCYRRLFGRVVEGPEVLEGGLQSGVVGATVVGISKHGRLQSTAAITDAGGHYDLLLPATSETEFEVVVRPPSLWGPAWSRLETIALGTTDRRKDLAVARPEADEQVDLALEVVGELSGEPVDAQIQIYAQERVGGVAQLHQVNAGTAPTGAARIEADGVEVLRLLRSTYTVEVLPAPGSRYRATALSLDLTKGSSSDRGRFRVSLAPRAIVASGVLTDDGAPEAGASLEFLPVGASHLAQPARGLTTATGSFEKALDPGTYLLVISPQSGERARGAAASPKAIAEVTVSAEATFFEIPWLRLPKAWVASGRVTDDQQVPVPGARIEVLWSFGPHAISLADGTTDTSGAFDVLLPTF